MGIRISFFPGSDSRQWKTRPYFTYVLSAMSEVLKMDRITEEGLF